MSGGAARRGIAGRLHGRAGRQPGRLDPVPGAALIEAEQLTKTYPSQPPVPALRGVSFTIRDGEYVAIVGPSGSGKTTLLHILGTLDRPSGGRVRLAGLDTTRLSDGQLAGVRASRIGFVFQQFFLAEYQTILDNVADGLLYSGAAPGERRQQAMDALTRVGLAGRSTARPTQLSGGQRQRVAIARALVGRPSVILADEPTGNLDSATGRSILALLAELHAAGTTVVVITHDLHVAEAAPRRLEMLDGCLVGDHRAAHPPARGDGRTSGQRDPSLTGSPRIQQGNQPC